MDILASSLKQKFKLIDKTIALQKVTRQKREAAMDEAIALRPLLQLLIQKTKELQTQVNTTFRANPTL